MKLEEPVGPWFINVIHLEVGGRPWCCSPVDYNHVQWSKNLNEVSCAACFREATETRTEI
jgi:hypothetical protein